MSVDGKSNNLNNIKSNHKDSVHCSESQADESLEPIEIKPELISSDILNAIIQEFILREGTNYGEIEYSLESKVNQVERQIKKGDVKIIFDPNTESVTLMTKREFLK